MFIAAFLGLTFLGMGSVGYAVFVEPWWIVVVEYEITSENLPDAFDGKKIVLIADIHYGLQHSYNLLPKVIKMTQAQSPDLVLLGGDYARECEQSLRECFTELAKLEAPQGVYAVLGNHDARNRPLVRQIIQDADIPLLENDFVWLKDGDEKILLVGVSDLWTQQPSLRGMQEELAESDFTILLSHNPDYFDEMSQFNKDRIDLMLSGHTHGGQVTLFGLYAPFTTAQRKFLTGFVKPEESKRANIIISNGIGTTSLPIRFFARPQLVVVTLKKAKPS